MDHSGMDHAAMGHASHTAPAYADGSGTARLPGNEGGHHGLMLATDPWMVMAHGFASLQYTDHSGPRGDDQLYVTSMAMLSAARDTGFGRVQFKSMLSLEPLMDARGYPNLFATGETADGEALFDRQHPHDLFMELAARVDFDISDGSSLFVFGGPVGEPALGPSAFMHRESAALNPEPPITHHWFDSTHITYGVVTTGISTRAFQIEASAFRGAEPDEERWGIETPRFDSYSLRATVTPSPQIALQASYGWIKEPEAIHPGEDERRFTASVHYANRTGLSATLAFSSKRRVEGSGHGHSEDHGGDHDDGHTDGHGASEGPLTAWLAEASWDVDEANTLFARFENVNNDEFFPAEDDPLHDQRFRVSKFQLGYARRIALDPFELAIGVSGALYAKPDALDQVYGSNPFGLTTFARLSLGH